jgi:hypothetical protein
LLEHVSDEGDDMDPGKCGRVSLVIFDQTAATCGPGKGAFDNPPSREEYEATL